MIVQLNLNILRMKKWAYVMTDLEIVQEAQERIEWQINYWRDGDDIKDIHDQHNSWLAHKAFFERHEARTYGSDEQFCKKCCSTVFVSYPCPESVAQAKAILGVE